VLTLSGGTRVHCLIGLSAGDMIALTLRVQCRCCAPVSARQQNKKGGILSPWARKRSLQQSTRTCEPSWSLQPSL
jgi:hypothetical protein